MRTRLSHIPTPSKHKALGGEGGESSLSILFFHAPVFDFMPEDPFLALTVGWWV